MLSLESTGTLRLWELDAVTLGIGLQSWKALVGDESGFLEVEYERQRREVRAPWPSLLGVHLPVCGDVRLLSWP